MTTCPQCGTQNLPGMAYCENCGAPLEQETAQQQGLDPVAAAASAQAQSILDSLNASEQPPAQAASPAAAAAPEEPPPSEGDAAEQAPAAERTATLSLLFPDGSSFTVTGDLTNVGRSDVAQNWHPELDVIPYGGGAPDLGVSRHQALIQREGAAYMVIDVGSTNGTFVNGKALAYNMPTELHDGDALAFGAFNAKVSIQ